MKKPLIILLSALTLIVVFASSVFAFINDDKIDSLLSAHSYEKALEKGDVQKALDSKFKEVLNMLTEEHQSFGFKTAEEVPSSLGTPYKVYKLKDNSSYFWEIPLKDDGNVKSAIIVDKVNGNWEIVHVGLRFSPELLAFYSNDKAVKEYVSSKLNNADISKIHRITTFYFDGIYVKTKNQEYIMPVTARPDLLGIKNMDVYTLDELLLKYNNMLSKFSASDEHEHEH